MIFKLTAALLAIFGVASPEAFAAAFEAFAKDTQAMLKDFAAFAAKFKSLEEANEKLTLDLKAAVEKVGTFETKLAGLSTLTKAEVEKLAGDKGSQSAIEALANIGKGSPVPPNPAPPTPPGNQAKTFPDLVAEAMASKNISKADAVTHCVATYPTEYAAWRTTGGRL